MRENLWWTYALSEPFLRIYWTVPVTGTDGSWYRAYWALSSRGMSNQTVSVLFLQMIIVVATHAKSSMSTLGPEIGETAQGEWSCLSLNIGSIYSDVSKEGCLPV